MSKLPPKSFSQYLKHQRSFCLFFILAMAPMSHGQTVLDTANEKLEDDTSNPFIGPQNEGTAPMLLEDEFEDIGPQYLLVPGKPIHNWFSGLLDIQWMNSSNPTQADDNRKKSADLRVLTAQVHAVTPEKNFAGGRFSALAGFRYQIFDYGTLSGDKNINGIPVSQNDFEAMTLFGHAKWNYEQWKLQLGLRWTQLNNDSGGSDFYHELVPSFSLGHEFVLSKNTMLTAEYDIAHYATTGQSAFNIRDDFNDRVTQGFSLRLLHRLSPKLYLQPMARVQYAIYSDDPNGDREDTTYSLGLNLSYYHNSYIVLRLFSNYQNRHSNGLGITDYDNLNLGMGGSLSYKF